MNAPETSTCHVCGVASRYVFERPVLRRMVRWFDCGRCGYFQAQSSVWLNESYAHAIDGMDTGIMVRNQTKVGRVLMSSSFSAG